MKDHTPVDISKYMHKVQRLPARRAWCGSDTWRMKGGMTGGSSGSTRGVSGGNGYGVVAQAFTPHIREN